MIEDRYAKPEPGTLQAKCACCGLTIYQLLDGKQWVHAETNEVDCG